MFVTTSNNNREEDPRNFVKFIWLALRQYWIRTFFRQVCMYDMYIFSTLIPRNFQLHIPFFSESLGYSKQISKTAQEGWIFPVQTTGLPQLLRHTALYNFFNEFAVSIFEKTGENFLPDGTVQFFHKQNRTGGALSIGRENLWKFSAKYETVLLPQRNRVITHSLLPSIDQGAWHK